MTHYTDAFRTPFGDFSIAVNEHGAVVATAFGSQDDLLRRFSSIRLTRDRSAVRFAREQVLAYCAGERREFELPLAPSGTRFQKRVWDELLRIPFGETRSYGQLAAVVNTPGAARAVGRANATNPICLIVPCHRVIGADGRLTGFAFGEKCKRRLLEHERQFVTNARAA